MTATPHYLGGQALAQFKSGSRGHCSGSIGLRRDWDISTISSTKRPWLMGLLQTEKPEYATDS